MTDWDKLFNGDYEKENFPFQYFINYKIFKGNSLFRYSPYYVIFKFPVFLYDRFSDFLYEVKWAYQRVVRGWDDRVVWSVDSWLDEIMPNILLKLKDDKMGIPVQFLSSSDCLESEEKEAKEKWDKELDKMIAGFACSKKLIDLDYNWENKEEETAILKTFETGMESFVKHYHSLWD